MGVRIPPPVLQLSVDSAQLSIINHKLAAVCCLLTKGHQFFAMAGERGPGSFDPLLVPVLQRLPVEGDFNNRKECCDVRAPETGNTGRAEESAKEEWPTLGRIAESAEKIFH